MYKIDGSKQYFNVVTNNGTTTVEIPTIKSGSGDVMNRSEILTELSRAVIEIEREQGTAIRSVYRADGGDHRSFDLKAMSEYEEAVKNPDSEVIEAVLVSYWDSGAAFEIPCTVNIKTREVFEPTLYAHPCDDDSFAYATVDVFGTDVNVQNIDAILDENDADNALDELYRIQGAKECWESTGGKTLDDAIHECRWAILRDAIEKRGHEAVADFVGTDISSDAYSRCLDETEAQMPEEEFEKFWEKYI